MFGSDWWLWAFVLIAQNASFTWSSRAKNSASLRYGAAAAAASNGIWILSMFFVVDKLKEAETMLQITSVVAFYTFFTVLGSVLMHWFAMEYLERGKRRVGADWK